MVPNVRIRCCLWLTDETGIPNSIRAILIDEYLRQRSGIKVYRLYKYNTYNIIIRTVSQEGEFKQLTYKFITSSNQSL